MSPPATPPSPDTIEFSAGVVLGVLIGVALAWSLRPTPARTPPSVAEALRWRLRRGRE